VPENERPLSALRRLLHEHASGELICAAPDLEVHVFLQRGRVAWCTQSGRPFGFTRKLFELTELDRETFRQIVDECRRDRLPLGETLIEWRVASLDQVREALKHQIVEGLKALAEEAAADVIFLERSREFAKYDEALTFELDEVLSASAASRLVTNADDDAEVTALGEMIRRFEDEVSGVLWTHVLDRKHTPPPPRSTENREASMRHLARASIDDGADFLAVRTGRGTVFGASVAGGERSLWCGLSVDATLGAAFAALTSHLRLESRTPAGPMEGGPGIRVEGSSATEASLISFLERARDVLGVVVLDGEGAIEIAATRERAELEPFIAACLRRRTILVTPEILEGSLPRGGREDLGALAPILVTGEGPLWCFGLQLTETEAATLWLLTCRRTSQGLGWAYVSALGRQLARRGESP
jgi:hypothetical protein